MKKFLIGVLAATAVFFQSPVTFAREVVIDENVYKWSQSTPRGNYYFNFNAMGYRINADDTLDLNILEVPTICTYDNIQIDDVIQKRRWRGQSTRGYNNLIGRADYLEFDLVKETVKIVRRADLDHTFTELDGEDTNEEIILAELSDQEISCKFYRKILKWAQENNEWIIQRSRGKLSKKDSKISRQNYPVFKIKWDVNKK